MTLSPWLTFPEPQFLCLENRPITQVVATAYPSMQRWFVMIPCQARGRFINPSHTKSLGPKSVQFTQSCPTLCNPMDCSTPGLPVHHQLSELTQTHVRRVGNPSNHLILYRSLLLLPSIPPSIRVFSNESTLRMRWPKYWSFSFSIIPSNEHPGLISFRMDALVGSPCSPRDSQESLQHHSSKASILWHSAFFIVQLSHPYMSIGKTIAMTRRA